jgi:hypothetical protein
LIVTCSSHASNLDSLALSYASNNNQRERHSSLLHTLEIVLVSSARLCIISNRMMARSSPAEPHNEHISPR